MDEHSVKRCETPRITRRTKEGDLWMCPECGRVWTLSERWTGEYIWHGPYQKTWLRTDLRANIRKFPGQPPERPTAPPPPPPPPPYQPGVYR